MIEMTLPEIVAWNVRREMDVRGWTQTDLADACELWQTQISEFLLGKTDHRLSTIDKLAKAFGITASAMLMPPSEEEIDKISAVSSNRA